MLINQYHTNQQQVPSNRAERKEIPQCGILARSQPVGQHPVTSNLSLLDKILCQNETIYPQHIYPQENYLHFPSGDFYSLITCSVNDGTSEELWVMENFLPK
jgi:hypothetical protein